MILLWKREEIVLRQRIPLVWMDGIYLLFKHYLNHHAFVIVVTQAVYITHHSALNFELALLRAV